MKLRLQLKKDNFTAKARRTQSFFSRNLSNSAPFATLRFVFSLVQKFLSHFFYRHLATAPQQPKGTDADKSNDPVHQTTQPRNRNHGHNQQ